MKNQLQRRVQRYGWDHAAEFYQRCWKRPLQPAQETLLDAAELSPGQRVLDVACGSGMVTFPAATAVDPGGRVVGTDLSGGMIAQARMHADEREIRNVSFKRMDAEALSLPRECVDVALCALGLMYVPDPVQALREMHRVLVPGGHAVAAVWGARKNCGWADVFPIVDRRVESDVCPLFFQLGTGNALQSAFRSAGFRAVTATRFRTGLPFSSREEACGAVFEGGPVALAWRSFDDDTRSAARADYLDAIAEYRTQDGYVIPGEFVVVGGETPEA